MITIQFKNLENVQRKLDRLANIGIPVAGRGMCKEIAEKITKNAKAFAPIWKGTLRDSIETKTLNENTFGVSTIEYGREVEEGHPVPFITSTIEEWAYDKSRNPIFAMLTLLREGARPSPFLRPAYDIVEAEIPEIIMRRLNSAIRREFGIVR